MNGLGDYDYMQYKLANCSDAARKSFSKDMENMVWRVNALLLANAIMAGVVVGVGAYGQRCRHNPFTRFIVLGATTLFLPVITSVVSISAGVFTTSVTGDAVADILLVATCDQQAPHSIMVMTWAFLLQNVMVSTSAVVAVDEREGRSIGPPIEQLAHGIWTLYLGISYISELNYLYALEAVPFFLTLAKLGFQSYAVNKARQSFALGRNPRLVCGYLQQQQQLQLVREATGAEHSSVRRPTLLVMGEETRSVEKQPHGYVFKDDSGSEMTGSTVGLVTIDRVWQELDSYDSMLLPAPTPQRLKDLCLSFALFKLLRCRFASYNLSYAAAGSDNFFWSLLLGDGEPADRVFGVLEDELSFLHDYYYSSLPVSFSRSWLPIMGIIISVSSIAYCIYLAQWMVQFIPDSWTYWNQIQCFIQCGGAQGNLKFGSLYFDMVPLFLLMVFVVTAEVRDLFSYTFSNWTKVALTCRLLLKTKRKSDDDDCHHSVSTPRWSVVVRLLLRCSTCKLMTKHYWDERMGQCSVLPTDAPQRATTTLSLVRRLLRLPDQKTKLNAAMKVHIIHELRSNANNNGCLSNGKASLCRWGQQGERFLWACSSKSASDIILAWQIATSILEVRYPPAHPEQGSSSIISDHRHVATRLSRYCLYLVVSCPQLLPDDDGWSKSLYKAVNKDARQALAGSSSTPQGYQRLVQLLSVKSNHEVLKNGVKLGQQLVETINGEEMAWKLLAGFWSEMILYVAPSDNLKGHKEAIDRGGELITLLWALLNHAGIVSRPTSDDAACVATAADSPGAVIGAAGTSPAGVV